MSKANQPVAYTASTTVYIGGALKQPGETFVTADPKGSTWTEVNPVEKAAADSQKPIKDDVNLTDMSVAELRAHAASLGINLGDVKSKDDIISVIAARDEPTL